MSLETATYINSLVSTNPASNDPKSQGDDHLRLIKSVLQNSFTSISGAVTKTHTELNSVTDRGLIAGQTWTGNHTFPATTYGVTATLGDSSTTYATTAFVAATAFSSALPAQTGNADKLLTTDGTTASFTANLKAGTIRIVDSTDTTKVLAFSLSGITTGTTRTVTMPDKSGTMAMTSDTNLPLLAVLTPTAAANVDALTTFTSSYDSYLIIGQGILPAADDILRMRVATAGVADTGSNYFEGASYAGVTITVASSSLSVTTNTTAAGKGCGFTILIANTNDATNIKTIDCKSVYQTNATPGYLSRLTLSAYPAANTISGVRFYWSGGANFTATGKIYIYGIKNS